jgi:hypothetical protein
MDLTSKQRDVLELLRHGVSQSKAIQQVGIKPSTWYNWKKTNQEFGTIVDHAVQEGLEARKASEVSVGGSTSGDEKLDTFLKVYISNGGIFEAAAEAADYSTMELLSCLNPLSERYNAPFHALFEDARKLLEVRCLDALASNIQRRGQGHTADARFLLERVNPEQWGKAKKEADEPEKVIDQAQALELLEKILGPAPQPPELTN